MDAGDSLTRLPQHENLNLPKLESLPMPQQTCEERSFSVSRSCNDSHLVFKPWAWTKLKGLASSDQALTKVFGTRATLAPTTE